MIRLHGYWRSGAAYRTRIALNLKGVAYEQVTHDLRKGDQKSPAYLADNPQGLVPALETEDGVLIQSPAIVEWLEERFPTPPLLPADPAGRATVRAMTAIIACDIHPLNNLRVLRALRTRFGADQAQADAWAGQWIGDGFAALEALVGRHGGTFAFGDTPTTVDAFLIPQIYSAERFGVDLAPFPRLLAINAAATALDAFARAHPSAQPDAD